MKKNNIAYSAKDQRALPPPWRFLYLRDTHKFRGVKEKKKKDNMSMWRPTLLQGAWLKIKLKKNLNSMIGSI